MGRGGILEGWDEREKSAVAMETTGREELGLCGWWGEEGGKCVCEGGGAQCQLGNCLEASAPAPHCA